ncbi:hypothetical protein PF007_g11397 [Phytophthora fragariae]|uniref:Uncharacterized protein n=1 Tax=Phytophthora fragariae TaxID=53985 RepID=A0A6A3S9D3_9STRA|nr:hypothetical protein PF007_g11397 [Phytophthora fragariae]
MPRKAKSKFYEEVENLSKLLRNKHGEDGVLVSQHEFWVDFRARVARNGSSTGLEALDDLTMAMFNGDDAAKKVAIYNEKKFARSEQADDDSDFEDDYGEYTAAGPTSPVQASV